MFRKFVLVLICLCGMSTFAFAQEAAKKAAPPAPPAPAVSSTEKLSMDDSGMVSFDFRDADIRNVFKILSLKSGVNIVASPEVTGLVTINLKNVPWKQALDVILQTYGYAYEQKGNIIMVSTIENMKQRRQDAAALAEQVALETKTFPINFGKASEIIESISRMKSDRGSINYDARTNTIIVTDTPQQLEIMAGVIKKLDKTTPQVLIEAKIVETNLGDTENLGIDWITQVTAGLSKRPMTWPFTTSSTNKYVSGTFPSTSSSDFTYGTLDFSQVQAVFQFLKTHSDTDILQNPRIVTMDNQPAQISVGSQYPIPTYTYNQDQAALQVSGWEYMDIGIIFNVTPHVNNANFVTLEVKPKITAILDFVTVENTSLPRLSNESANTRVMIKDGETLVIGGLIKDQVTQTKKKTPVFGDIPIVGLAFQKSETTVTKTDLLIFITPHIVTPDVPKGK